MIDITTHIINLMLSLARTTKVQRLVLGSQSSQELVLLLEGLETTMTVLGGSINELDVEGLVMRSLGGGHNALAKSDSSLARTTDATLQHEPVLVDLTVMRESAHRGDGLLSQVSLSGAVVGITLLAHAHDSLVDLSTMMVTLLTGTGQSETASGRMPSTNTSDLSETTVRLAGKPGNTPTGDDTLSTVTASGGADINGLTQREDRVNVEVLLEEVLGEVNLVGDGTSVDLDFAKVGHLLSQLDLADLGMGEHTHHTAVLLDAVQLKLDVLGLLGVLLGILGESLSLGAVPVLVESALDLIGQMLSPDGGQSAQTMGGLHVSDNTHHSHGGGLDDGHSLDTVLLVDHLGTGTLDLTHDMGHASLVSNEGSKRHRGRGVKVLGERTHATSMVSGTLLGKKLERSMAGCFELTVRHDE
jgi:hypothetical protein